MLREIHVSKLTFQGVDLTFIGKCRQGSITPCSGSSPSARRCRATLKFEDEEAKEELRQPAMVRAEVTNDPIPPQRENKSEKHSYPLNLPSCVKMPWDSTSSESTSISSVDLLAVSNYNGSHPRKVILHSHFFRIYIFNRSEKERGRCETLHREKSRLSFLTNSFHVSFIVLSNTR